MTARRPTTVLVADDDPDDRLLIADAFEQANLPSDLQFVEDGEEVLDYLHQRGSHADPRRSPRPGLILLDLNMPRKDGREALAEVKAHADLRRIPVVVLTTSNADEDVLRSYELGVSGFIRKPASFEGLLEIVEALGKYWIEVVELPPT